MGSFFYLELVEVQVSFWVGSFFYIGIFFKKVFSIGSEKDIEEVSELINLRLFLQDILSKFILKRISIYKELGFLRNNMYIIRQ